MKTLFLDIETAPNLGWVWAKYDQNVLSYERERYMLCFSYKWAGQDETHVVSQIDFPTAFKKDRHDDSRVLKAIWNLLDEADVIIGHNVRAFDLKMVNAFFITADMPPPSPYQTIDTLIAARSVAKFNSNSLKDLCKTLGIGDGKKDAGGFATWLGCMAGDQPAWDHMIEYARRDTELLEPLYHRLRPYMKQHPTMNWDNAHACPICTGTDLKLNGTRRTKVSRFQTYQCRDCGSFSSSRLTRDTRHTRPAIVAL